MTTGATCSWLPDAVADLEALAAHPNPALARRLGGAVRRLARMNGGSGLLDALGRPGTTPFVALVDAATADLGLAGDERAARIGRATVLLYLYVRLQDDLVDEEELVDRASVYAMEAALSAHLEQLAAAGLPPSGWRARSSLMERFARVAASEVELRAAGRALPAEAAGEKFLAMGVPLVALAALADRPELMAPLTELVIALGNALQMVNDVLNAAEDHMARRPSALLDWLDPPAGLPGNALRARLLSHPAMARALALAGGEARRAFALCEAHGLPSLRSIAEAVARTAERTSERLLGLMLGVSM